LGELSLRAGSDTCFERQTLVVLLGKLGQFHVGESVCLFSNEVACRCLRENHAHVIASISLVAARLAAIVDASSERSRWARLALGTPGDERPRPCGAALARFDRHGTGGIVELAGTTFQTV
jgi:hypothetical protein